MAKQVSADKCPLCGRQGAGDQRFCSECFQRIPNENGIPGSLRVTVVYGSAKADSGPLRWVLAIGVILALLAGIYYGRTLTSQEEKKVVAPKAYQDQKVKRENNKIDQSKGISNTSKASIENQAVTGSGITGKGTDSGDTGNTRPLNITKKPVDKATKPEDMTTKPVDTTVKPLDTTTKSPDTTANPADTTAKPADTSIK